MVNVRRLDSSSSPNFSVLYICLYNKVYHTQVVRFLLYLLGQIVT